MCVQCMHMFLPRATKRKDWTTYHQVYTSDSYSREWNKFLILSGSKMSPIFVQYVSHFISKQVIVTENLVQKEAQSKDSNEGLM